MAADDRLRSYLRLDRNDAIHIADRPDVLHLDRLAKTCRSPLAGGIALSEATVHAIVLRRRDSGESDRRLTVLTREVGKIDIVAKGARKSGSRLAGSSDPLVVAKFSIATGKKNQFITQAQPMASFRGLRTDYERLSFGLALCELYSAVIPWEEPFPEAYELLASSLHILETHERPVVAMVWAQLQLLSLSGFLPAFDQIGRAH